jgi:tRNA-dihydrouridine synthase
MKSFWKSLPQPFTVLAPMEGVTDFVFREIIAGIGKPDVFFTEFVNVEGLTSEGYMKVKESLMFGENENPIVAQIWGTNLEAFYESAKICKKMGFSGIDINMGCPDKGIMKRGSCGALIKNPELAHKIIDSVRKGSVGLPASVKTRLGFSSIDLTWIKFLLSQNLDALTIHLRTVSEMSKVPAHWEIMPEIMKLRNEISKKTLIIGNGDILTRKEVGNKYKDYKCDGFMVGRGIFQNPWIFNNNIDINRVGTEDRIDLFIKHINLFDKTWKDKNPALLKKFCKAYINNFSDASSIREKIMDCNKTSEMITVLDSYKTHLF